MSVSRDVPAHSIALGCWRSTWRALCALNRGAACSQVLLCRIRLICYLIFFFFPARAEQVCVTLDVQETGQHFSCPICDLSVARLGACEGSLKTSRGPWSLEWRGSLILCRQY